MTIVNFEYGKYGLQQRSSTCDAQHGCLERPSMR